jgi:hypothetical protein
MIKLSGYGQMMDIESKELQNYILLESEELGQKQLVVTEEQLQEIVKWVGNGEESSEESTSDDTSAESDTDGDGVPTV